MVTNFPNMFPDSIDAPSEGQTRLIVEPESDYNSISSESPKVKVCLQKWATGIGWFNQKSLSLTLEQATFLGKEIERTTANHKMRSTQSAPAKQPQAEPKAVEGKAESKIIQFPAGKSKKPTTAKPNPSHSEAGNVTATILPFRPR